MMGKVDGSPIRNRLVVKSSINRIRYNKESICQDDHGCQNWPLARKEDDLKRWISKAKVVDWRRA
jgi:hypothetical protein